MQTEDKTGLKHFEAGMISNARKAGNWARFLSVCGFVISVLLVMVSIFGGSILHNLEQASVNPSRKAVSFSLVMMVCAVITFFLSFFLFLFSKNIGNVNDNLKFSKAFFNLKLFFFVLGCLFILLIIYFIWQMGEGFINS